MVTRIDETNILPKRFFWTFISPQNLWNKPFVSSPFSKVGSGLILVGTIGLTIACPPVGAAAKIARYAAMGASAIGLFE